MPQALSLHAVYAAIAEGVYTLVFNPLGTSVGLAPTGFAGDVVWGVVYAIVFLVGATVVWGSLVLDLDPDADQLLTVALAHLAYGFVLGVLAAAAPHLV